jgi:hypothetical protein
VEDIEKVIARTNVKKIVAGRTGRLKFKDIVHLPFRVGAGSVLLTENYFGIWQAEQHQLGFVVGVYRATPANPMCNPPQNPSTRKAALAMQLIDQE